MVLRQRLFTLAGYCCLLCGVSSVAVVCGAEPLDMSAAAIQERIKASVTYLASDELEGRGITTGGIDKAADYIAQEFAAAGLQTNAYNGTPFHTFILGSRYQAGPTNTAELKLGTAEAVAWKFGRDFTPLSLSSSGQYALPVVFAGYGITAPEHDYDDYAGLDVTGKAVLILRHEPQRRQEDSRFDGTRTSKHGTLSQKVVNAIAHGAAGVLLVTDHAEFQATTDTNPKPPTDKLLLFQVPSTAGNRKIPVIHLVRRVIEPAVEQSTGTTLASLEQQIDTDLKPHSRPLDGLQWTGDISVVRSGKPLRNVVGVLPGSGPQAAETLIVGAHYDHLGRGGMGSLAFSSRGEIHNGADDNGSGTATLLEIARQLGHHPDKLPRRVIFVAFTAEESGLIGSERYVRDPLVPLTETVAMLNLDMVGRLRNEKLTVYGTGTATEFDPLVDKLGEKYAFTLSKKRGGMGPSDHASFYPRKIPVLHYFTGLHREYHRPEDDSPLLNIAGMQRISQLVTETVVTLATAEHRPSYLKVSENEEMEGLAELMGLGEEESETGNIAQILGPGQNRPKGGKPFLGIAPVPDSKQPGYEIFEVTTGTAAEKAGLRAGDVILKFGDTTIEKSADLSSLIAKARPFQKITVQFRRNETRLETEVTLGER